MAIKVSDIIQTVRGLIHEDNEKDFKDTFLIMAVNAATDHLVTQLQQTSEFLWLTKGTITISSGDVSAGTQVYALATRAFYVSNYVDLPRVPGRDWRPTFDDGSSDFSVYMETPEDYVISLPNFMLSKPPTVAGTITYWYKASPAPVTKPSETITIVHDVGRTYYIEYVKWYANRREEQPDPSQIGIINFEIEKIRRFMRNSQGFPRGFVANWDDVADYDGDVY